MAAVDTSLRPMCWAIASKESPLLALASKRVLETVGSAR
jgi:hypothetical protein